MATAKERHPQVFVERHEDPRRRTRKVPMEVLSLGMSRTGTMTMQAALKTLGYPTWHFVTMTESPPDMAMWLQAFEAKYEPQPDTRPFGRAEFDSLLSDWSAVTDYPPCYMSEELISAYPDAKVVLVERDVERWYKSFSEVVIQASANIFIRVVCLVDKTYIGQMAALVDITTRHYFHVQEPRTKYRILSNPAFFAAWRANAKDVYREHNERVKRATPKERLLLFKLDDGWEPLCKFLNKPVPDVPFPRVNETKAAQAMVSLYIFEGYKRSAKRFMWKAIPAVVALVAVLILWRA